MDDCTTVGIVASNFCVNSRSFLDNLYVYEQVSDMIGRHLGCVKGVRQLFKGLCIFGSRKKYLGEASLTISELSLKYSDAFLTVDCKYLSIARALASVMGS